MAFVASFTVTQDKGGAIVVTDTSNYASSEPKGSFISRQIQYFKSDGTSATIPFSFNDYPLDNISLFLERDFCLRIKLTLATGVPQTASRYSAYVLCVFNKDTVDYLTNLSQSASLSSLKKLGNGFYKTLSEILINNDGAFYAANALQQLESQSCLDRNYNLMTQQALI